MLKIRQAKVEGIGDFMHVVRTVLAVHNLAAQRRELCPVVIHLVAVFLRKEVQFAEFMKELICFL